MRQLKLTAASLSPNSLAHPPNSAYNPIDVVPDLTAFVSGLLGPAAGSIVASIESPTPDLLIHLALVRKLELIHATVLSVKAKADHAHQVAISALNVASTAANTSRTYARRRSPHQIHPGAPRPEAPGHCHSENCRPKTEESSGYVARWHALRTPSPATGTALPSVAAYSPAQRRLFSPLGSPQRIPNGFILPQTLPALLANLLLEKKLPREAAIFTATINDNGNGGEGVVFLFISFVLNVSFIFISFLFFLSFFNISF